MQRRALALTLLLLLACSRGEALRFEPAILRTSHLSDCDHVRIRCSQQIVVWLDYFCRPTIAQDSDEITCIFSWM